LICWCSIIGSVLLVAGLYNVLWGKTREEQQVADHDTPSCITDDVEKGAPAVGRDVEKPGAGGAARDAVADARKSDACTRRGEPLTAPAAATDDGQKGRAVMP
jgi:hypothetical protein